jgi:hypothetical protein
MRQVIVLQPSGPSSSPFVSVHPGTSDTRSLHSEQCLAVRTVPVVVAIQDRSVSDIDQTTGNS